MPALSSAFSSVVIATAADVATPLVAAPLVATPLVATPLVATVAVSVAPLVVSFFSSEMIILYRCSRKNLGEISQKKDRQDNP